MHFQHAIYIDTLEKETPLIRIWDAKLVEQDSFLNDEVLDHIEEIKLPLTLSENDKANHMICCHFKDKPLNHHSRKCAHRQLLISP